MNYDLYGEQSPVIKSCRGQRGKEDRLSTNERLKGSAPLPKKRDWYFWLFFLAPLVYVIGYAVLSWLEAKYR